MRSKQAKMNTIVCFKPRVADSRTAFEPMALVYKFLENKYNYNFKIIKLSSDTYTDDELDIISIPETIMRNVLWKAVNYIDHTPVSLSLPSEIKQIFEASDAVITVDPTSRSAGIVGVKTAISTNTPVWFDAGRTTAQSFRGYGWKKQRRIVDKVVRETTGIIVTSPKVIEYFRNISLFDKKIAKKFTIMGHPTDVKKFSPQGIKSNQSADSIKIITIARLVPEKGLYYILEAIAPILQQYDNVQLTILGEGPLEHALKQDVADRGLAESIAFRGTIPHDQVPAALAGADIFVSHAINMTNWEEFFGAANIEAMACGLPCVLSDSGSIPYVARAPDGVKLIKQRDVGDLRKAIKDLVKSPSKRSKMGRAARKFVERNYSVEVISEKYHQMLQQELES